MVLGSIVTKGYIAIVIAKSFHRGKVGEGEGGGAGFDLAGTDCAKWIIMKCSGSNSS